MIYDITLTVVDSSTSTTHAGAAISIQTVQVVGQVNTGDGGGITDGDKGDVTVSGGGTVWTVDARAITAGKLFAIGATKLLGRHTGTSGDAQEIGVDGGLEFHGGNLRRSALTGDVTASAGDGATTIANGVVSTSKLGGDVTTAGKALLDDADASAQRTTLGLGTAATAATGDFAAASHTHTLSNLTQSGATTGQVAQWDGAAWVPATVGSSVMKPRWNSSTSSGSTTVTIPLDNTTPQSSEGVELITIASVTPSSASNTIQVDLTVILSNQAGSAQTPIIALFLDSNTNASAATYHSINVGYANLVRTCFLIPSWSGSKDIKIRIGAQSGTLHWNKSTTTDLMGGASSTVIVATELAV
jgi:hypothetical protein